MTNPEKEKAIELAVSAIEKQFGKGAVMRLGSDEPLVQDISAISTGSVSLDLALGVGGIPRGRVIEIYGPEASGKTTLTLHMVAEAQKAGGVAAFIDAEHALDVGYARKLGVRTEDLLISQPDSGEQALEICEMLVRSGAVDLDKLAEHFGSRCRAVCRIPFDPHLEEGAEIDLGQDILGYLRASEISRDRVEDARNVLKEGDEVTAVVVNIDRKTRNIQLSIKQKDMIDEQGQMANLSQQSSRENAGTTSLGALLRAKLDSNDKQ